MHDYPPHIQAAAERYLTNTQHELRRVVERDHAPGADKRATPGLDPTLTFLVPPGYTPFGRWLGFPAGTPEPFRSADAGHAPRGAAEPDL